MFFLCHSKIDHLTLRIAMMMLIVFAPMRGTYSCNESMCASIVTRCFLDRSCVCEVKNSECFKTCFICLGAMYSECYSCVQGMSPKKKATESHKGEKSIVEDLVDPATNLFKTLTSEPDNLQRWISITYPIEIDMSAYTVKMSQPKIVMQSNDNVTIKDSNVIKQNCTVAFISQCLSQDKCKSTCGSLGASSYRWFHNACCECVGENCINYGIRESRKCNELEEIPDDDTLIDLDDYDFDSEADETDLDQSV